MAKGWILLHRQIEDHFLYNSEPFDRTHAWIDLILKARHSDESFIYKGKVIHLKKGQLITSPKKLADRWQWSRNKVYRFLRTLSDTGMVTRCGTPDGTLVTIVNYDKFQSQRTRNGTPNETPDGTPEGAPDGTHTKNYKELNKELKEEPAAAPLISPFGGRYEE